MAPHPSGSRKDDTNRVPDGWRRREHKGLCVNCASRETCLFPRAEGGVWHCREYVEDEEREDRAAT